MAKIVQTQYRENYGAHDWDGTGECPQYWKNKGGSTYVVIGVSSFLEMAKIINYKSDYSEEYITFDKDVSDEYVKNVGKEASIDFEPWEDRNYLYINSDMSRHPIVEVRKSGFTDLRRGIESITRTWEYANAENRRKGECEKFSAQYLFKNGMVANSEEEACKILEHLESRVMA